MIRKHDFDNSMRFEVTERHDALLIVDETSKALRQYSLRAFLTEGSLELKA